MTVDEALAVHREWKASGLTRGAYCARRGWSLGRMAYVSNVLQRSGNTSVAKKRAMGMLTLAQVLERIQPATKAVTSHVVGFLAWREYLDISLQEVRDWFFVTDETPDVDAVVAAISKFGVDAADYRRSVTYLDLYGDRKPTAHKLGAARRLTDARAPKKLVLA